MLAAGTLALALSTTTADAARYHHRASRHITAHHFGKYLASRHLHYQHRHFRRVMIVTHRQHRRAETGARPSCFYVAASMGGPCGCWAAWNLLGRVEHVWRGVNLWLAQDWLKFPRTEPAPGTAAVWPHRHVAPVVAVHNDKTGRAVTVTVRDSWATHEVRTAGLIFVQPPTVGVPLHRPLIRWMSDAPL
jgi:hypothetical protein